jgi:hypothetical protein
MIECVHCHAIRFDNDTMKCDACGKRAVRGIPDFQSILDGLYHNVLIELGGLQDDQFSQLLGLMSPRSGYGPEDAIAFDDDSCRLTHQFLLEKGIHCARLELRKGNMEQRHIVLANSQDGVKRALEMANAAISKMDGVTMTVVENYD